MNHEQFLNVVAIQSLVFVGLLIIAIITHFMDRKNDKNNGKKK